MKYVKIDLYFFRPLGRQLHWREQSQVLHGLLSPALNPGSLYHVGMLDSHCRGLLLFSPRTSRSGKLLWGCQICFCLQPMGSLGGCQCRIPLQLGDHAHHLSNISGEPNSVKTPYLLPVFRHLHGPKSPKSNLANLENFKHKKWNKINHLLKFFLFICPRFLIRLSGLNPLPFY